MIGDECTWHHKTFLVQSVYWHLAIKLYFTCYRGNTDVEWTSKWESAQKVDYGEEKSPAAHTGTRTREVSITSTALYRCILQWIWLVWPCSFFRKLQTLGVVWEINQKSRSFRSKCRRQMHCSRQKHTKRHRQTGGQTDRHTQTDRQRERFNYYISCGSLLWVRIGGWRLLVLGTS